MRNWINLVEDAENAALAQYLRGDFYHGTARSRLPFYPGAPAYLTTNKALALEYAEDDSEVDGGTPHVLHVRLHCVKPFVMHHDTMQDLHNVHDHGELVQELRANGYDCVVGDIGADEICVIDSDKIEIIEEIKMRDADAPSTRGQFGSYSDTNSRYF